MTAPVTQPDLLDVSHEQRLEEARTRVEWARHYKTGVMAAQKTLVRTMAEILREELGKKNGKKGGGHERV